MDALADIDHLGHVTVDGHGNEPVRLVAIEAAGLDEEVDRLADRVGHCLVQVLVEAEEDVMRLRLDARPLQLQVLADDGLDLHFLEGALQRGEVHLAVSLRAVRVAGPDEPALEEDRHEQGAARDQLFEIHVRSVLPGPHRVDRRELVVLHVAFARRRIVRVHADCQRSRKGAERNFDSGLECNRLPLRVDIEES